MEENKLSKMKPAFPLIGMLCIYMKLHMQSHIYVYIHMIMCIYTHLGIKPITHKYMIISILYI